MKINPNLRYCEHSYWCKFKHKKEYSCYLGWEIEDFEHEYKQGGLLCKNMVDKNGEYIFRKNISGFELLIKITLSKKEKNEKKENNPKLCR